MTDVSINADTTRRELTQGKENDDSAAVENSKDTEKKTVKYSFKNS